GLHISEVLMERLKQQNFNWSEVILHVGAGTFRPVSSPTIGGHEMHAEYFEVDRSFLERLYAQLNSNQPIVSVGTTSTRCLESLYYLGSLFSLGEWNFPNNGLAEVKQWVASEYKHRCTAQQAIYALLEAMQLANRTYLTGSTQLIITPGIQPKIIDGLITNFHQPNSTLLLIVAAITGEDWRKIYAHALAEDYRFLSYGDGSLLWKS
ncbi:MAG: S-adenosylmethionine:tRNA ribosyltransferase-isomerase, partial [Bacteroidota bacterium]